MILLGKSQAWKLLPLCGFLIFTLTGMESCGSTGTRLGFWTTNNSDQVATLHGMFPQTTEREEATIDVTCTSWTPSRCAPSLTGVVDGRFRKVVGIARYGIGDHAGTLTVLLTDITTISWFEPSHGTPCTPSSVGAARDALLAPLPVSSDSALVARVQALVQSPAFRQAIVRISSNSSVRATVERALRLPPAQERALLLGVLTSNGLGAADADALVQVVMSGPGRAAALRTLLSVRVTAAATTQECPSDGGELIVTGDALRANRGSTIFTKTVYQMYVRDADTDSTANFGEGNEDNLTVDVPLPPFGPTTVAEFNCKPQCVAVTPRNHD